MKLLVVYFAEGDFQGSLPFTREDEARAWCSGFEQGVDCGGGGGAVALVLPLEDEELDDRDLEDEAIEKARAAWQNA